MNNLRKAFALVLVFGLGCQPAFSWGLEGHLWINQVAAMKIPKSMPLFLRNAVARITYLGPEPDRWRNQVSEPQLKYSQEPDHFFDTEALPADLGELPDARYRFITRLHEARAKALAAGVDKKKADELLPEHIGFQPYIALEVYGRLKVAMREYRHLKAEKKPTAGVEQNIIFYAGWLGHYVADASQPLHVTVNYDGWVQENPNGYTTQKGLHSDFESRFVKENMSPKSFSGLVHEPVQLKDPFHDYQAYMKETLAQVPKLYDIEKAGGLKEKGSQEARDFTNQRLAAGAQMLLNMWYTAWQESAVDPPDPYAKSNADTKPRQKTAPKDASPKKD
jgi:hypothetical protein